MNPILYSAGETAFDTNGIGILRDAKMADVIEELNGQFELEMQYPVTGLHFSSISKDCILLAKPNPVSDAQPFIIYRITKPMNGVVTVYARHVAYELRGITVTPFTSGSCALALQDLKSNATTACPFEFWTDKSTAGTMTVSVPKSIWALLGGSSGSVLDVYGGEYEFDRYKVKLHNRRGADRGVSIRYGKNLTSLEQDENCANVYTGVHPYWTSYEGALVQLPEKILYAEGNYSKTKIMPLDLSMEFEAQPTVEQLRTRAQKYMKDNDIGTPDVSWKVEFVQLEQTEEYKGKALLERVLIGDTVSVEFAEMGVSASARAVSMRYDSLQERYKSVALGRVRANVADTIAQQQEEIARKPSVSLMQSAITSLTSTILGAKGGAVRFLDNNGDGMPDTLYIADDPDPDKAKKVWRFNYEGWGASSTGYNGPFVMGGTLADGMLADFITAGTLNAALVKVINLIAERLSSVNGSSKLVIDGAELKFMIGDKETFSATNWDDMCYIYMYKYDSAGNLIQTAQFGTSGIGVGGKETMFPDAGLFARSETYGSRLYVDEIVWNGNSTYPFKFLGRKASWKSNGDGTYTLVGT